MKHPFEDLPEGLLGFPLDPDLPGSSKSAFTESLNNLQAQYDRDASPQKVDLMTGVYKTDRGEPFILPSVVKVGMSVGSLVCDTIESFHLLS